MTTQRAKTKIVKTRDAARSQKLILQAATDEFAKHGFAGARIDQIALTAGTNKRLIYYYYKSKDDLFLATLENAYADIRGAERELHLDQLDPAEAIRQLVSFTWHYYLAHPEFLSLLNSENQHDALHLKRSGRIQEMNSPLVAMIQEVLERGRFAKLFRNGVDPIQLYISIAALCYFYLSNNQTLSTIFGQDLKAPKALAQRLSHMQELVLGYVLR
jgi:AcrR family transcriptional regulator